MNETLKNFLQMNFPKKNKGVSLGVSEDKIGGEIQNQLGISCQVLETFKITGESDEFFGFPNWIVFGRVGWMIFFWCPFWYFALNFLKLLPRNHKSHKNYFEESGFILKNFLKVNQPRCWAFFLTIWRFERWRFRTCPKGSRSQLLSSQSEIQRSQSWQYDYSSHCHLGSTRQRYE